MIESNSPNIDDSQKQKGVVIVPDSEKTSNTDNNNNNNNKEEQESSKEERNRINMNSPNDLNEEGMDAMNPQLLAALREINDDPSYLKPGEGELVDLSQFQMDPEKLEEMIEIFDWIESQLPPDDPQQIQNILKNVEKYINGIDIKDGNYTDDILLSDLTILPEFLYQVDNGVDFMKMNGLQILLKTYNKYNPLNVLNDNDNKTNLTLNMTLNYQILSQIMDVIGVASQNNPKAIQYTHQFNLVSFIIDELNNIYLNYKNNENIIINGELMNKLIFTLSSITRQSDIGLQHLEYKHGPKILYKCGKLLSKEINRNKENKENKEENKNLSRAFKKLLTMISDIVILNGNRLEYSKMFLRSNKWCGFMIERGLLFHPDAVLQFIDYGLQRNYCVENKMLISLHKKLEKIINDHQSHQSQEYYDDDGLLTQSINMLKYIQQNFDIHKKTEL